MLNFIISKKGKLLTVNSFVVVCIVVALLYYLNSYAYILCAIATLYIFFKPPLNKIIIVLFGVGYIFALHFFIAVEVTDYGKTSIVKTPTGRIVLTATDNVSVGDVIIGDFEKLPKLKTFFKPSYKPIGDITTVRVPILSNILKARLEISSKMFYDSGGKVAIAQALIFADKRFIDENIKDEYTVTGLSHLLAMSGMHTGILIAIVMSLLIFIPLKFRMIVAIFSMALICLMGGFTVTVVRASIFATAFMVAYLLDYKVNSKRFMLFVFGMFVIISPNSLLDISFLLSFGAVFGIIYFATSTKNYLYASMIVGIAATLITAPLAMYAFGMTNHLSIFSTVIMTPIAYIHILFALITVVAPNASMNALADIEQFSNFMVHILSHITYFGFILKTIPLWLLIVTVLFVIATLFTRYKLLSLLALLIIFFPSATPPDYVFPALKGSSKGFVAFADDKSEIFYQGTLSAFRYDFIPAIAKYGVKEFDYGSVRIFGGENNYIKIKNEGIDFYNICLNKHDEACKVIYMTRSNTINKSNINDNATYIIYKNDYKSNNIIEIFNSGHFEM